MKIKIKNFVFAGFAAAIFAGNAMAAGDTIVTSKAYVDQKLGLKANTADLAAVATSGSYTDLLNKPTIPAAQVNADWNASSGVAQILNKPTIPTVPTNVSAFTNDANYITSADVPAQVNADWTATSGAAQILNKPTLAAVATSGNYSDLSGTPNLATVATSGSYNDLSNKPTIPAAQVQSDWNATTGMGAILNKPTLGTAAAADTTDFATAAQGALAASAVQPGDLAAVATSGDYDDLTNKPTIPAAQVNADWNASSGVAQILNKPTLGSAAAAATTDFATAAQGAKADTAIQPGNCTENEPCALVNNAWVRIAQVGDQ